MIVTLPSIFFSVFFYLLSHHLTTSLIFTSQKKSLHNARLNIEHKYSYKEKQLLKLWGSSIGNDVLKVDDKDRDRQTLRFNHPESNVEVLLIGSMHYNPQSIDLTKKIIDKLGEEDRLGAVIVESCPIRWNKTMELHNTNSLYSSALKLILNNEMISAYERASNFGAPVVLGDQLINITNNNIKSALKQSFMDIINPIHGWKRIYNDINKAVEQTLPSGDKYLGVNDFLDPNLIKFLPVSLIR